MSLKKGRMVFFRFKPSSTYLISLFISVIVFVFFIILFQTLSSKNEYIYAKIKVGQGLWWASTSKPSIWLINSIKKGEKEYDLIGRPIAEIIDIKYYPAESEGDGYNIYLSVKLAVNKSKKDNKYTFKRSPIAVGSPIDLEFPSSQVSGSVINISEKEVKEKYLTKTLLLVSQEGYTSDYPYNFESIKVGDKYFDGENYVFEVLDKNISKMLALVPDSFGILHEQEITSRQNIIVKARIKAKEENGHLMFGEEQIVSGGKKFIIRSGDFNYKDFVVASIE